MMRDLLHHWLRARLERSAAAWVIRLDEDKAGNEARFDRGRGGSDERAQAFNRARRAFYGAASAAEQIYHKQAFRETPFRSRRPRDHRVDKILAAAFSLFLASGAIYFIMARLDALESHKAGHPLRAQRFVTRIGEVRPVRLADGTRLLLDTDTEISVDFSAHARTVHMVHGRARFDVARDPLRPFAVTVGDATITDRGTVFDVEAYRYARVRLISGSVDVAFGKATNRPAVAPLHLAPGQQVRFDPLSMVVAEPTATPPSDAQWVTGMKTFDDVSVGDILDEVNRYSTTKIVLSDSSLGSQKVFADLDLRNTAAVADNLAIYLGLTVDRSVPGLLMLRRPDTLH